VVRDCYAKPHGWRRGSGGGVKMLSKRADWLRRVVLCAALEVTPDFACRDDPSCRDDSSWVCDGALDGSSGRGGGGDPACRACPATRDSELGTAQLVASLGHERRWLCGLACGLRWATAFAEVRCDRHAAALEKDVAHGLRGLATALAATCEGGPRNGSGELAGAPAVSPRGAVAALELVLAAVGSAVALDLCSAKSGDKLLALALRALNAATCRGDARSEAALAQRAARFVLAALALHASDPTVDPRGGTGGSSGAEPTPRPASALAFGFGAPPPLPLLATLARHFNLLEASSVAALPQPGSRRQAELRAAFGAALAAGLERAAAGSLEDTFARAAAKAAKVSAKVAAKAAATGGTALADSHAAAPGGAWSGVANGASVRAASPPAWALEAPPLGLGAAEPLFQTHGEWLREAVGGGPCLACGLALLAAAAPPHTPHALRGWAGKDLARRAALAAWVQSPGPAEELLAAAAARAGGSEAAAKLHKTVRAALSKLAKELDEA
jgi:hypothetical protein